MPKKGVSKKTNLVNPLIKEGSKKSKEVIKALGIERKVSPASSAADEIGPYNPTPENYKYKPKKKSNKKERLTPEQKAQLKSRREESAASRATRLSAEATPVTPQKSTVRTPDPTPRTQTMTAVTGETIRPATNPELRRGIPSVVVREQTKPTQSAGPRLPRIGQIYRHSDGRMMRVSAENINEVHADAKRTVLPEAGRAEMTPVGRPAPLPGPRGGLRPNIARNTRGNRGGLGVAHDIAKDHVDRALGHLDAMASAEHGSGAYRQAQKSFHVVHGEMGKQNMSKPIHTVLQLAHNHIDTKQPGTEKMLAATKEAVSARLHQGKLAEEERTWRQMQGEKKGGR